MTHLIDCLVCTKALSEVFSDENVLRTMLRFELALGAVQDVLVISPSHFNIEALTDAALRAGTPAIPFVEQLRAIEPNAHHGATSQDLVDTTLVLLLRECRDVLARDHARLTIALARISNEHARTVMRGRTLLQPAQPITFGLKAAGWLAALRRGWSRVESRISETSYLQFGGASGTLDALGDRAISVSEALAAELALKLPDAPWHTHRDRLGAALAALSIYTASLGKMALDIALLMQHEVGEASEPGGNGRGGSSAMPYKHNPTACMLAVAAAKRTPGLLANFLNGMLQEHERALGGWQSEWSTVASLVQSTGVALESMVEAVEGLSVDAARMSANANADLADTGSAEIFRQRLLAGKD